MVRNIIILLFITVLSYGQIETNNTKILNRGMLNNSRAEHRISQTILKGNNTYDTLGVHLDSIQKLREDINAGVGGALTDTTDVLRVDLNKNVDSLAVHLDTVQTIRSDANTNTANITSNDAEILVHSTMFQDTLGRFNIKSSYGGVPGAVGDSTDATAAWRSVLAAAGSQKIIIPAGVYILDSAYTNLSPQIFGESSDKVGGQSTKIIAKANRPILYVDSLSGSPYGTGGNINNIYWYGSNSADSTNQHAIVFNANKRWTVDNCSFSRFGGNPIKLGDDNDAIMITIKNSHFSYNHGTLIHGRRTSTTAINAIDIINNHMYANFNHCIDVVGQAVNIILNKIEFNDSTAIIVNPIDQSGIHCYSTGNVIRLNRFEDNGGGEIFIWQEYVSGSENHLNYGTVIEDNIFISSLASYDKPEASAMITVKQGADGNTNSYLREFKVGHNAFIESAGMPYVDLGGDGSGGVKEDTKVWIKEEVDVSAFYLNMGNATFEFDGMDIHNPAPTGLDANGFFEADLHPVARITISGNTTISNIADAEVDGYMMWIVNGDATDTLTINETGGLILNGTSIALVPDDAVLVMYSEDESTWLQMTPVSDN